MRTARIALLVAVVAAGSFTAGARWGEPRLFGADRARKFSVAYGRGWQIGQSVGYDAGHSEGHDEGYDEGHDDGYNEGYDEGTGALVPTCHESYIGVCLNPYVDYDCREGKGNGPEYTGEVRIVGPDEYDLDGNDKDGIGCEGQ